MGDLLQKSSSLERQLQFEGQKLQNLANGLARKNVFQVGAANRQTQITQAMESVAGNIFAMKGLSDVNYSKYAILNVINWFGCSHTLICL